MKLRDETREKCRLGRRTRVMSVVRRSMSRSSADRSENPGRTCLACSLSSVATTSNKAVQAAPVGEMETKK